MKNMFKNIIKGFGTFSIYPEPTPFIKMRTMTVAEALHSDWVKIGGDINKAIKRVENEQKKIKQCRKNNKNGRRSA